MEPRARGLSGGTAVHSDGGIVVSAHTLASAAGLSVIRTGGNAVDAAVATGMALAVVHPTAGNIGGGGFMLVRTRGGRVSAFDFREMAPAAATPAMYLGPDGTYVRNSNHEGYRSVGVPGTVAGFDLALRRHGSRKWRELVAPAVRLAENGFRLSPAMARSFAALTPTWRRYPSSAAMFLRPDGANYRAEDLWRQPLLAATLKRIQEHGADGFYRGPTARLIEEDMRKHGGLITADDLDRYRARERQPILGRFRDYEIYSMPPPSSGGVALVEMLNILEGYDLRSLGHNSPEYLHRLAEAMRFAFTDRARYLGDPDFNPRIPVRRLTSKRYADDLRRKINPAHAGTSDPSQVNEPPESPETTHFSVIDREGNAVVVTYTLEQGYGCKIAAERLGFLYNNEMGDFNPQPGHTDSTGLIGTPANRIAPRKRMLSSMTPTLVVRDGQPRLLVGSPGGRTIINTVLQVTLNVLEFGMSPSEAVSAGRIHHQWLPDEIVAETGSFPSRAITRLRGLGHTVRSGARQGSAMVIGVNPSTGLRTGASDPREADGSALGEP